MPTRRGRGEGMACSGRRGWEGYRESGRGRRGGGGGGGYREGGGGGEGGLEREGRSTKPDFVSPSAMRYNFVLQSRLVAAPENNMRKKTQAKACAEIFRPPPPTKQEEN